MILTEKLHQIINFISPVPADQVEKILEIADVKKIAKGACFIREGEISRNFAFVMSGLFRYFYADEAGNEFTKGFFPEHTVIAAYSALVQQRASYFTIEALEDSEIVLVHFAEWKKLMENELCWHKFLIALLEKGYCTKESREREFLLFDAETRYRTFSASFPGLEKRIKQHVIASYLGITPVALSRIRKRMGIVNTG